MPSSTVTNGIGGAWEYRRGGYSLVTNGAWYARAAWKPWGDGTETSPTYVKYSAELSRDFYLNAFHKLHLNGAWFDGRDLDRFVKYQFGMFDDTRIHGVPGRASAMPSSPWRGAPIPSISSTSTGWTPSSSTPGGATNRAAATGSGCPESGWR